MLSKNSLKEILELVEESNGSFFILEEDEPKLAVLDYAKYRKLLASRAQGKPENTKQSSKSQTILVTGAAGRLGSRVVAALAGLGHKVVAIDNLSTGNVERLAQGVDFIQADTRNNQSLKDVFTEYKVDIVVHLAEVTSHKESFETPEAYFLNNIEGGFALLKAMNEAGVKRLVYRSGPHGPSPLSHARDIFRQALRFYYKAYGIDSITLFMPAIAFPEDVGGAFDSESLLYDDPVAAVLQSFETGNLSLPNVSEQSLDGTPKLCLISAPDAVSSIVKAVDLFEGIGGPAGFVVEGISLTLNDLIEKTIETSHKMISTTRVPADELWQLVPSMPTKLPTLQSEGYSLKHDSVEKIISSVKASEPESFEIAQPEVVEEAEVTATQPTKKYSQPVSLSDLLSSQTVPFIKPHNS